MEKHIKNMKVSTQINEFINYINNQTRYLLSRIKVEESIFIGFLINQEELKRDKKFNLF